MAIKPIPFNTEMVKGILDGCKIQTRRAIKPAHGGNLEIHDDPGGTPVLCERCGSRCCGLKPPYQPGDILWVPEAWKCVGTYGEIGYEVVLRSGRRTVFEFESRERAQKWVKYRDKPPHQWQSPYFMPKEAAQIFLCVRNVRVQRLNGMSEEDAMAEGFEDSPADTDSPLERFSVLWDKTIKRVDLREYGWHANPWVWVIEFERCEKPEGWCKSA